MLNIHIEYSALDHSALDHFFNQFFLSYKRTSIRILTVTISAQDEQCAADHRTLFLESSLCLPLVLKHNHRAAGPLKQQNMKHLWRICDENYTRHFIRIKAVHFIWSWTFMKNNIYWFLRSNTLAQFLLQQNHTIKDRDRRISCFHQFNIYIYI